MTCFKFRMGISVAQPTTHDPRPTTHPPTTYSWELTRKSFPQVPRGPVATKPLCPLLPFMRVQFSTGSEED